jgi:hypothetical protein
VAKAVLKTPGASNVSICKENLEREVGREPANKVVE